MPRLRDETKIQRRQVFVDAARRCAVRRGFQVTTVDDVCAEAGLSKGAFYAHFASKHQLLAALIDDDTIALRQVIETLDRRTLGPTESLRRLAHAMLRDGAEPDRVQVRVDIWTAALAEPVIRDQVAAAVAERRRLLRRWVEDGIASGELSPVPANAVASLLLALNDGLMLHHALDASSFRWPNVRIALDALLDGIRQ
ncbi:MAG: TetR/AcrR family transcriptional regulator [Candidatus Dormibacteraeota bacterium]|nr:TetR/AcrR family transcriptional regulator [Candidatus Dormibacteraeota bacterium]